MNKKLQNTSDVTSRYNISISTLYRWLEDKDLDFPRPGYIRKKPYWRVGDLDQFDDLRFQTKLKATDIT